MEGDNVNVCVCLEVYVGDVWEVAERRQVDQPGLPVLTIWYVGFAGGC